MNAAELIAKLRLQPLPQEGGFYRQTYSSAERLSTAALPSRYAGERPFSTAIYFLLRRDCFSAMHRLRSDEIFHFYQGQPVTMLQLHPDGHAETIILGSDLRAGAQCQCVVPRGVWQGLFLNPGGDWALMGTTVAPGFEFEDFELGSREALTRLYPEQRSLIARLTRR